MTDRYREIEEWVWCPIFSEIFYINDEHIAQCTARHEPLYHKVSQCNMELRLDWGYLRCEEDEGHRDNGKLPVHAAKDGDGLMIWWQSA